MTTPPNPNTPQPGRKFAHARPPDLAGARLSKRDGEPVPGEVKTTLPGGHHTRYGRAAARGGGDITTPEQTFEDAAADAAAVEVLDGPLDEATVVEAVEGSRRRRGQRSRRLAHLPDDDPFVLVDALDATGGIEGTGKKMGKVARAAFNQYCLMPPTLRTLKQLAIKLEREWGKAPNKKSLQTWHREYEWERLVEAYDTALARWRLHRDEQERKDTNGRQAKAARAIQAITSKQMVDMVREYNAPPTPLIDPVTRQVLVNPRTGKPIFPPRKSLAGFQGLASAYDIAVRAERVALGLPTAITNGTMDATVKGEVEHTHAVTLQEWRERTARERGLAAPTGPGQAEDVRAVRARDAEGGGAPRALPAPGRDAAREADERARRLLMPSNYRGDALTVDDLIPDDLDDLPDEWIPADIGAVVDADPDPDKE